MKRIWYLVPLVVFVLVVAPVFAVTSFQDQAIKFYDNFCTKNSVSDNLAISCYLFEMVVSFENKIESLEQKVSDQDEKINELVERIAALEPTPTTDPCPVGEEHTYANWYTPDAGFTSTFDAHCYSKFVFFWQCGVDAELKVNYSDDQTNWTTQLSKTPSECTAGGNTNLDVLGNYVQVVVGSSDPARDQFMFVQGRFTK